MFRSRHHHQSIQVDDKALGIKTSPPPSSRDSIQSRNASTQCERSDSSTLARADVTPLQHDDVDGGTDIDNSGSLTVQQELIALMHEATDKATGRTKTANMVRKLQQFEMSMTH